MECLVQSTNGLILLIYYPNEATAIEKTFWRTVANFWNVDPQLILVVKSFNDFILPFSKGLHWNYCFWRNANSFMTEGMMVWILVITRRFIPNNTNKWFMKYHNRSGKKMLQVRVVHDTCFLGKQRIDKKLHLIRFYLYIVKGWRYNRLKSFKTLNNQWERVFLYIMLLDREVKI